MGKAQDSYIRLLLCSLPHSHCVPTQRGLPLRPSVLDGGQGPYRPSHPTAASCRPTQTLLCFTAGDFVSSWGAAPTLPSYSLTPPSFTACNSAPTPRPGAGKGFVARTPITRTSTWQLFNLDQVCWRACFTLKLGLAVSC